MVNAPYTLTTAQYTITAHSEREAAFLRDPVVQEGLAWGKRRQYHPEGSVGAHVAQIHAFIDSKPQWPERDTLYCIATIHDAFKRQSNETETPHEALAAAYYLAQTRDTRVAEVIRRHDAGWHLLQREQRGEAITEGRIRSTFARTDLDLLLRFMVADRCTRELDTVWWVQDALLKYGLLEEPVTGVPTR